MFRYLAVFAWVVSFATPAHGGDNNIVQWQTTNVQALRGFDYELGSKQRTIMTIEHANRWTYGDFYMFADLTFPDQGQFFFYVEPTLRFSLGKIAGRDLTFGVVKDVYLAVNAELPKAARVRLLAGVSADLDLPGFKFFKVNMLSRDNLALPGSTYQLTVVWKRPFQIGKARFLVEGFADFAGHEDIAVANQLIVPRFLLDAGSLVGGAENKLFVGVEWQYWRNKFGVSGVTESAPQIQIKWVF